MRLLETRPLDFLESEVFCRWPREIGAVGFKLFYYHARDGALAAIWDYIRSEPEILIVHIKRLNILEQYLSLTVAHATNIWSTSGRPSAAADPIQLDPDDCQEHFEKVRAYERDCEALFAGRQVETVTYEELVVDRSEVMRRICAQLGCLPNLLKRALSTTQGAAIHAHRKLQGVARLFCRLRLGGLLPPMRHRGCRAEGYLTMAAEYQETDRRIVDYECFCLDQEIIDPSRFRPLFIRGLGHSVSRRAPILCAWEPHKPSAVSVHVLFQPCSRIASGWRCSISVMGGPDLVLPPR